nr:RNA-directed DNA polymerase, eukaryota, reverse transcriptase zinc-binding domain protein [Tanacetum cinerariifolium]
MSFATLVVVSNVFWSLVPGILVGYPSVNNTGFELTKGSSHSFEAPKHWVDRIWGRTGYNFNHPGHGFPHHSPVNYVHISICSGFPMLAKEFLRNFYADDAVFMGDRISVEERKVDYAASKIGCLILKTPFSYLGSKVGGFMSHIQSWNEVVDRVNARLSKWKMKTLSIGGRIIGKKIKAAYPSIWMYIVQEMDLLKQKGIEIVDNIQKKLGNREDTCFSEEVWRGDKAFKILYPRIYALEFDALRAKVEGVSLVNMKDTWSWSSEGSGDFLVASMRRLIDDKVLPRVSSKTRWIKAVPIKINVHAWKTESYWPSIFSKLAEKKNIEDLIVNVGAGDGGAAPVIAALVAGGAADTEENKEEPEEESYDDTGLDLFG